MTTLLRCVNASGQPRLEVDAFYELVLDVKTSARPGREGNQSGYIVKPEGDDVAIPYVYNRLRFVNSED